MPHIEEQKYGIYEGTGQNLIIILVVWEGQQGMEGER